MQALEKRDGVMKAIISPSLLSANLCRIADEADALAKAGIRWLHLDVMDGSFVPNITFGMKLIGELRKISNLFFDTHLMIQEPDRYIETFANGGANLLAPHIEAMRHPQRTLAMIRQCGLKAAIALDPDTEISRLRWLLPDLDMIVLMGVNPGFSGQTFIPQTIAKLKACRAFLAEHGHGDLPIQLDGGASPENAKTLLEAGANILVSGSAFFAYKDYRAALKAFEDSCEDLEPDQNAASALNRASAWADCANINKG